MKILGLTSVLALIVGLAFGIRAQEPPPTGAPSAGSVETRPLPQAPVEQFAPCRGITDLKKRDACIARQTSKGNPATPSLQDGKDAPDAPSDMKLEGVQK